MGSSFSKKGDATTPSLPRGDIKAPPENPYRKNKFQFNKPKLFNDSDLSRQHKPVLPYMPYSGLHTGFQAKPLYDFLNQSTSDNTRVTNPSDYNLPQSATLSQPTDYTRQAIEPPVPNTSSYHSFKNDVALYKADRKDLSSYDLRTASYYKILRDNQRELIEIRKNRERLLSDRIIEQERPKPVASLESCVDLGDKYRLSNFLNLKYFKPKPERPELTEDILKVIQDASRSDRLEEILVVIDNVNLLRKDFRTLLGLNWLNDEVINAYFHLMVMRGQEPKRKKVYAFNTFFYPKLRDSGYSSVKRWTRKVNIFSYDYLLVPVHLGNHWCLAFVNLNKREVSYFDSLGGSDNRCCDILLNYLKCESEDKRKQEFDTENWITLIGTRDLKISRQGNGSDCGVFACQFAEYLTRGARLSFTQEHMPYFRKKMIYELMTKRILE